MPVINGNRTQTVTQTLGSSTSFDASNPPAHLKGLLALNPKLAQHLVSDPGLRAFLELNKDKLVGAAPPAGALKDDVKLDTWCHGTGTVSAAVRDEEYIVVVARGSAYPTTGNIEFPLQGSGKGTSDGRILYVCKTKDVMNTFVADDKTHYPGSGAVSIDLPAYGKKGERVELTYCRIKPDAQGRAHAHHAAWPDTFDGVYGGFSGRDQELSIKGGGKLHLECPE